MSSASFDGEGVRERIQIILLCLDRILLLIS